MKIPLHSIERDLSLQMRAEPINQGIVREYAAAMKGGAGLPAIVVFGDEQGRFWPGDGWHRMRAVESLALSEIEAEVRPGGREAAFKHALGANDAHGLRRSRQDKLNAIRRALADPEIRQMSSREIARLCGVDDKTVGKERGAMPEGALFDAKRTGADGRIRRVPAQVRKSAVAEKSRDGAAQRGAGIPVCPGCRKLAPDCECAEIREETKTGVPFNVIVEMRELEGSLAEEFARWPAEKRHAFCVAAANFAKLHDPEIAERTKDALDEMLTGDGGGR